MLQLMIAAMQGARTIYVRHASYISRKIAKIGKAYTLHAPAIGSIHENNQIMDLKS